MFANLDGTFDLIVFDPPFRCFAPRDMPERATTDEDYRSSTTFFEEVDRHLRPQGRLLVFYGSSGDIGYLRHLIDAHGFACDTLREVRGEADYWTFRLTRA